MNKLIKSENYFLAVPNQEELLNKEYNVTQKEVEEMVEIVRNWMKQQPHLSADEGPVLGRMIKYMLRMNKICIEITKQKIEAFCSLSNIYPEFLQNRNSLHPRITRSMDVLVSYPLRKPLNSLTRINCTKLLDPDPKKFILLDCMAAGASLSALKTIYDLCFYDVYLFDLEGLTLEHALKINPVFLVNALHAYQKIFSGRISGLHFLNTPSNMLPILNLSKKLVPEKISNRMHIHEDLDSLHKHIPREFLPEDYGGTEMKSSEIIAQWRRFFEDNNDLLLQMEKYMSIEELRVGGPVTNNLFGVEGSFRKLEID